MVAAKRSLLILSHQKIRCAGSIDAPDFCCSVRIAREDHIEPRSIRADVATPAVAEVATSASDTDAAAPTSATTPTPATAAETAASETAATTTATSATATAGQCLRGRRADQDGRGADEIDEHQSHRCDAAGNDIVAFSHSQDLPVNPAT
jgi:hypothetical protein